jgi:hypothetical protein
MIGPIDLTRLNLDDMPDFTRQSTEELMHRRQLTLKSIDQLKDAMDHLQRLDRHDHKHLRPVIRAARAQAKLMMDAFEMAHARINAALKPRLQ